MAPPMKIVVCGAGFLGRFHYIAFHLCRRVLRQDTGSYITKAIVTSHSSGVIRQLQLSSRNPNSSQDSLASQLPTGSLLPPVAVDITTPESLTTAFESAQVVISLVGIMNGSPQDFERIQWKGAANVARAARNVGAKLIHFSAIGADARSEIPYVRTKALAEASVMDICPEATIFRPSIIFGPEDGFFNVCPISELLISWLKAVAIFYSVSSSTFPTSFRGRSITPSTCLCR